MYLKPVLCPYSPWQFRQFSPSGSDLIIWTVNGSFSSLPVLLASIESTNGQQNHLSKTHTWSCQFPAGNFLRFSMALRIMPFFLHSREILSTLQGLAQKSPLLWNSPLSSPSHWVSHFHCQWRWVKLLSLVWLFATPWTVAYQVPPSTGFSIQEYWSGVPFPSPGDLPDPGIEPKSPALYADALPSEPPGSQYPHTFW